MLDSRDRAGPISARHRLCWSCDAEPTLKEIRCSSDTRGTKPVHTRVTEVKCGMIHVPWLATSVSRSIGCRCSIGASSFRANVDAFADADGLES